VRPINVQQTVPPASEPVSTADAKTHLRVDVSSEDTYIAGLVSAARSHAERYTRRSLVTSTYKAAYACWPANNDHWEVSLPPFVSFVSIIYQDQDGASQTLASLPSYLIEYDRDGMRRYAPDSDAADSVPDLEPDHPSPISLTYTAGSSVDDVDPSIVHAIKLIVSNLYEDRGETDSPLTPRVVDLLRPFRLEHP